MYSEVTLLFNIVDKIAKIRSLHTMFVSPGRPTMNDHKTKGKQKLAWVKCMQMRVFDTWVLIKFCRPLRT